MLLSQFSVTTPLLFSLLLVFQLSEVLKKAYPFGWCGHPCHLDALPKDGDGGQCIQHQQPYFLLLECRVGRGHGRTRDRAGLSSPIIKSLVCHAEGIEFYSAGSREIK